MNSFTADRASRTAGAALAMNYVIDRRFLLLSSAFGLVVFSFSRFYSLFFNGFCPLALLPSALLFVGLSCFSAPRLANVALVTPP